MLAIDPAHVRHLWRYAKPLLARAFESNIGDVTLASTEAAVLKGDMLLWVAWSGGRIIAAVTTELVLTPKHKLCVIGCCGGEAMARWLSFIATIEAYAKAEGCDLVRVMGRKGWERVLPGYAQPWIVLDKNLKA